MNSQNVAKNGKFRELRVDWGDFNGLPFSRQFWMDILQEKPVGPPKGAARKKAKKVHSIMWRI